MKKLPNVQCWSSSVNQCSYQSWIILLLFLSPSQGANRRARANGRAEVWAGSIAKPFDCSDARLLDSSNARPLDRRRSVAQTLDRTCLLHHSGARSIGRALSRSIELTQSLDRALHSSAGRTLRKRSLFSILVVGSQEWKTNPTKRLEHAKPFDSSCDRMLYPRPAPSGGQWLTLVDADHRTCARQFHLHKLQVRKLQRIFRQLEPPNVEACWIFGLRLPLQTPDGFTAWTLTSACS